MTLVTPHFSLEEFVQPAGRGCPAVPYPAEWVDSRLRVLCEQLEILRGALPTGASIHIGSGYRSPAYNTALPGTAKASQHMQGRAADIQVKGVTPAAVHALVLGLYQAKKIIIGGLGSYPTFTHVDVRPGVRLATWTGSPARVDVG